MVGPLTREVKRPRGARVAVGGARWLAAAMAVTGCAVGGGPGAGPPTGVTRPVPGVEVRRHTETYPIRATDRATIGAALRPDTAAGRRFPGMHRWTLSYRLSTAPSAGECRVKSATVFLESTVVVPEWTPPPGTDPTLVAAWRRFLEALTVHELGHRELVSAGAERVRHELLAVRAADCRSIVTAARSVADPLLRAIREEDAAYDATTRHGAAQGAWWPVVAPLPDGSA